PVDRAVATVNLKLAIRRLGTGHLTVTGTPDEGKVTFANLTITQPGGTLRLAGTTAWTPGKGNLNFDLDIATQSFPVADIVKFLELGTLPVTGNISGTLHIRGRKNRLEGRGAVTVRNGLVYGEAGDEAMWEVVFRAGRG